MTGGGTAVIRLLEDLPGLPGRLVVRADLDFTVEVPRSGRRDSTTPEVVHGTVTGAGQVITVNLSTAPSLLSTGSRSWSRTIATALDRTGLEVRLVAAGQLLVRVGHRVRAPWWQRPLTGSRSIAVVDPRAVLRALRGPALFGPGPSPVRRLIPLRPRRRITR